MKIAEAARELVFPFTDLAIVQAMIWFWLMSLLIDAAGFLGLWLAVIVLPAFFRYALYLLDARACGRTPPPPGIELFNIVGGFWSLFPLLLLASLAGSLVIIKDLSPVAGLLMAVTILLIFPASMAILAVTRSPLQSLNPVAIRHMIVSCGPDYLWVPASILLLSTAIGLMAIDTLPMFLVEFLAIYVFYLLFTMTGAILHARDVAVMVDIPDAQAPDETVVHEQLIAARQRVADHAYGFISRGNQAGGLSHIRTWLHDNENDSDDAWEWFFREMLEWESTEPALFYAQDYLSRLLYRSRDREALKLLSRCLHENPQFRPLAPDRARLLELAESNGRDDLLARLR